MSEHWTDRISAYVDGDLPEREARRLEEHVARCPSCAAALEELRALVGAAGSLPDVPPERDLWPGIEARLASRSSEGVAPKVVPLHGARPAGARRVALTVPQLAAAGIALVLFSAGAVWLAMGGGAPVSTAQGPAEPSPAASASSVAFAASWEAAVAELETEFARRRPVLEPETILAVERNLALIDDAIAEARSALEADPSSGFLNGYVADAMRRKVDLLRRATRIQRTDT
ncbi:MAG TPA: zf-HC2 domain-containing protein [Longimicrobiales bacterium]|nr:zf-HC2 domain-containing protein [Longimicrobiales bacterium]